MFEQTIDIAFSFPVAIYTVFLGVMVVLWLVTLLGVLDLDFLDFDVDLDGDVDIDLNMDSPTAEAVAGFLISWGLVGVPITIMLTVLALSAWIVCYYIVYFLFGFIPSGVLQYVAGLPALVFSFFIAVKVTAVLIKPLKPLFKKVGRTIEKTVLGQVATVRSSKVTSSFGEAVINDLGADLLLKIWTDQPNSLSKGDKVVPIEYDSVKGTYLVVPESEFKN
ncbi:DUF1449 domain-containing protein [Agaribacterium sp. ZY112]|uniref:DUF1449 domain-containing protein n=1 Tax=Agaribacterium sp. ZY112 TaxID=3233574 RepID=UPI003523C3E3